MASLCMCESRTSHIHVHIIDIAGIFYQENFFANFVIMFSFLYGDLITHCIGEIYHIDICKCSRVW